MKSLSRQMLEAVVDRLMIIKYPEYPYPVSVVETGTRQFDEGELRDGLCIGVTYGGSQREQGIPGQQQNAMTVTVEAHRLLENDVQLEGLDAIGTIEKALLEDKRWAIRVCRLAQGLTAESDDIRISEDGRAVVATVDFTIPIIKHHNRIFS